MGYSYLERMGYKPYRQNMAYSYRNGKLVGATAEGGIAAKRKSAVKRTLQSQGYRVEFVKSGRLWQVWTKPTFQGRITSAVHAPLISIDRKKKYGSRGRPKKWINRLKY